MSSATISSIRNPQGFPRKLWHPIRRRSSSNSSLSFTLLGMPGTTALSAIAPVFTIFVVGGSCSLKQNLSALKPGFLNWSHFARKVSEPRLLLLPLFHSLSAKHKQIYNTMKAESKCGRRGQKGWLICLSDPSVPGMFSSVPTVATFPIRSWAKFPEPLPSNRNQSVTSGFPLGSFRSTAPWARKPDPVLTHLSMLSSSHLF